MGILKPAVVLAASTLALLGGVVAVTGQASAAGNPYQRGPDPTVASVAATRGTFATAQQSVPAGNGFNGGTVYYPTDTSLGTWGAVAIVPGYSALFANEEAWMGPWLASFGFVVLGIETNSRTDGADARGTELLAGLDYLTQQSAVRTRVDATRLGVIGHSAGGAGALLAAEQRPSLRSVVGLAPGSPTGLASLSTDRVPTMFISGQNDTTVTRSYLNGLYTTLPATTQNDWVEITGNDHLSFTRSNPTEMRVLIPWLKIFIDSDTRYTQFLCPRLADSSNISMNRNTCPLVPPGGASPSPSVSASSASPSASASASASASPSASASVSASASPSASGSSGASSSPPPPGACNASYRTVNSWPGGFQGEVTVTAGSSPISGWTVRWTLASGQSVSQVWNGTLSASGSAVTVSNAAYNGAVAASGSTTFGFLGNGAPSAPALTCTSP